MADAERLKLPSGIQTFREIREEGVSLTPPPPLSRRPNHGGNAHEVAVEDYHKR